MTAKYVHEEYPKYAEQKIILDEDVSNRKLTAAVYTVFTYNLLFRRRRITE